MVADRHPFKCAGERVYEGLVLVYLRARSMTQTRMPRVPVRHTASGTPRRQELLSRQKAPFRRYEFRRWNDPESVDRSRPQDGSGTWSRWTCLPGFGEPCRRLLPVWVSRAPRRLRLGELAPEKRRIFHVSHYLTNPPLCTGLRLGLSIRRCVPAICPQSTALRHLVIVLERLCPASVPVRSSSRRPPTPHSCRGSLRYFSKSGGRGPLREG